MVVKCNRVKEGEMTHDDEENCKDNVAIGQDRFVVQHAGREKKTGQMLGEEKEVGASGDNGEEEVMGEGASGDNSGEEQ